MGQVTFNATLSADRASVRIEVMHDGEVQVWADMTPIGMSNLIESFAAMRASMADQIPMSIAPGSVTAALTDPRWQMPPAVPEGHRVLSLRHPGLGWLSFAFPQHEAEAIASALVADHPTRKPSALN